MLSAKKDSSVLVSDWVYTNRKNLRHAFREYEAATQLIHTSLHRQSDKQTDTHTYTHNSVRLTHTAVHTTVEDYGTYHCKTPVCTDTQVNTSRHTLAAPSVVILLNEDVMVLNLAITNNCGGRSVQYKTLDAFLYCTTKSYQWHVSTFRDLN